MRKEFVMIALMAMVALGASAQKNEKGRFHVMPYVAGGFGGAVGSIDEMKGGFTVRLGAEAELLVADNIGISLGAEFQRRASNNTNGVYTNPDGVAEDIKVWQGYSLVNFPVLFQYHFGGFAIKAGVQPGILVNAETVRSKSYTGTVDFKDQCNTFQVAIPVGVSYTFKVPITLDFRFAMPVTTMAKSDYVESGNYRTPVSVTLGIGYRF